MKLHQVSVMPLCNTRISRQVVKSGVLISHIGIRFKCEFKKKKKKCYMILRINVFISILFIPADRPHHILCLLGKRLWDLQQEDVGLLPSRYLIFLVLTLLYLLFCSSCADLDPLIYVNTDVNLALNGG